MCLLQFDFGKSWAIFAAAAKGAKGEHRCVSACGEGSPILWAEGKGDAAIQIEHLWDEMAREYDVDTLCGYVLSGFQREQEIISTRESVPNTPLCICSERGVAQGGISDGSSPGCTHRTTSVPSGTRAQWWYHAWVAIRLKEFRHKFYAFLHADKAQAATAPWRLRGQAQAGIPHTEINLVRIPHNCTSRCRTPLYFAECEGFLEHR